MKGLGGKFVSLNKDRKTAYVMYHIQGKALALKSTQLGLNPGSTYTLAL